MGEPNPGAIGPGGLDFVLFQRLRLASSEVRDLADVQSVAISAAWNNAEDAAWDHV